MQIDGSGRVHLVQSVPVLRPDEQVLQKMFDASRAVDSFCRLESISFCAYTWSFVCWRDVVN